MDTAGAWNVARGGSTVPLRFRIFDGRVERTDLEAVKSFSVKGVLCRSASTPADVVELTPTDGSPLRYDTTGQRFVQNWQTHTTPVAACHLVTMTAEDDSGGT